VSPRVIRLRALAGRDSAPAPGRSSVGPAISLMSGAAIGLGLSFALSRRQYGAGDEALLVPGISVFGQTVEASIPTPERVPDRYRNSPFSAGRERCRPHRTASVT
jgi:hypothetical protein